MCACVFPSATFQPPQSIPLERDCYLPAFDVELHDAVGNRCPKRAFKQVTVSCAGAQAFKIWHPQHKTATYEVPQVDALGPVTFSEVMGCYVRTWRRARC